MPGLDRGVLIPTTVSVVITVWNRYTFVDRAVRSALAQADDAVRVEVVVIDDGSSTPIHLDEAADPRVSLVREPVTTGVAAARNRGVTESTGEWVTFLDDDDVLLAGALRRLLEAARGGGRAVVVLLGSIQTQDEGGQVIEVRHAPSLPVGSDWRFEDLHGASHQVQNSMLVPRQLLVDVGGWDERIPSGWDHDDLFLRLNHAADIVGISAPTYGMTEHAGRTSRRHNHLWRAQGMMVTMAKHPQVFARHPAAHAHYLASMGFYFLQAGEWPAAATAAIAALRRDPWQRRLWFREAACLLGPTVYRGVRWLRGRAPAVGLT